MNAYSEDLREDRRSAQARDGKEKGADWVEKTLGWSLDLVERPRKSAPKEGVRIVWEKFMPSQGFQVLPRRWNVERTFSWIEHNRRMSKDYEKLCASGEAFVCAAMSRIMLRRLTRD